MKTKIKFYVGKLNTKLYDDGMVKKSFHYVCLPVKLIDYVFKISKNYYPQVTLEECKYPAKEKKINKYINNYLESIDDK